ncbi:MAG: hypothetical protein IT240_00630 [Bacteroidia bacterium]|jgi:hypothetical protein|nr:hypothetical protein [Bacteroidia bacterium]
MLLSKVANKIVIDKIKASVNTFELLTAGLIMLRARKVPDRSVEEMM